MSRRKRICSASGRNYLLARQPRCIGQSLADVLPLQIGVIAQDFVPGEAFSHQRYDQRDGYPHAADASAPPHLARLEGDPVEGACTIACRLPSPYLGHFLDPVLVLTGSVGPPPKRRKRSPRFAAISASSRSIFLTTRAAPGRRPAGGAGRGSRRAWRRSAW